MKTIFSLILGVLGLGVHPVEADVLIRMNEAAVSLNSDVKFGG